MESIRNLVHVRVGDRKGLAARIVDVGDDEVVVRPPMDEDGPVVPAVGTPVEVGWITKAGVRWHQAAVVDVADDDGTKLILRFLDEAVRLQRRRAARVKLSLPIDVWVDMNAAPLRGRLLDVGGAALRAEIPAALDVGDVVQIRVAFPGAEPMALTSRVYRIDGSEIVLVYELFAEGTRERLVEAAFHHALRNAPAAA